MQPQMFGEMTVRYFADGGLALVGVDGEFVFLSGDVSGKTQRDEDKKGGVSSSMGFADRMLETRRRGNLETLENRPRSGKRAGETPPDSS